METKHTAGQWQVSKTVNDYAIYADSNDTKDIAAVYQYSRSIPQEEAEANAKLIAAAPDMLSTIDEAINQLQNFLDNYVVAGGESETIIKGEIKNLQAVYYKATAV